MQYMKHGDMLENVLSNAIICHGTNCKGVMGKGIALSIKQKYPLAFEKYRQAYETYGLILGKTTEAWYPEKLLLILNLNTQYDYYRYGNDRVSKYVNYDAVRNCFKKVSEISKKTNLPIHYPKIGAGLGGGDWNTINNIICEELKDHEHNLWVL